MCTTPAPPSTALVAASIWSGTGEVKTSPGQAASSMPRPTKPPCSGSGPGAPPRRGGGFPRAGAPPGDRPAVAHDDPRRAVVVQEVRVRGGEAGERFVDERRGIVEQLLHG